MNFTLTMTESFLKQLQFYREIFVFLPWHFIRLKKTLTITFVCCTYSLQSLVHESRWITMLFPLKKKKRLKFYWSKCEPDQCFSGWWHYPTGGIFFKHGLFWVVITRLGTTCFSWERAKNAVCSIVCSAVHQPRIVLRPTWLSNVLLVTYIDKNLFIIWA